MTFIKGLLASFLFLLKAAAESSPPFDYCESEYEWSESCKSYCNKAIASSNWMQRCHDSKYYDIETCLEADPSTPKDCKLKNDHKFCNWMSILPPPNLISLRDDFYCEFEYYRSYKDPNFCKFCYSINEIDFHECWMRLHSWRCTTSGVPPESMMFKASTECEKFANHEDWTKCLELFNNPRRNYQIRNVCRAVDKTLSASGAACFIYYTSHFLQGLGDSKKGEDNFTQRSKSNIVKSSNNNKPSYEKWDLEDCTYIFQKDSFSVVDCYSTCLIFVGAANTGEGPDPAIICKKLGIGSMTDFCVAYLFPEDCKIDRSAYGLYYEVTDCLQLTSLQPAILNCTQFCIHNMIEWPDSLEVDCRENWDGVNIADCIAKANPSYCGVL